MQAVKSAHTGLESVVTAAVEAIKIPFSRYPRLPGTPDLLLPTLHAVMFIHGCFWHMHGCRNVSPRTNRQYWREKLIRNRRRDRRVRRVLNRLGWSVLTLWECRLRRGQEIAVVLETLRRTQRPGSIASKEGHGRQSIIDGAMRVKKTSVAKVARTLRGLGPRPRP